MPDGITQALFDVDSRAALVEGHLLRRIIAKHSGMGRTHAHRKCVVVETAWLLKSGLLTPDQFPQGGTRVLLIEAPDPARMQTQDGLQAALLRTWRLLFHASVHAYAEMLLDRGALTASLVQARIHSLGRSAFDEAQAVLHEEGMLLPCALGDDLHVYIEFAATYLEFKFFDPHLLARYFGDLDMESVEAVLSKDIPGHSLYWEAKLPGAPTPKPPKPDAADDDDAEVPDAIERRREPIERLDDLASTEAKGNQVRAMLVWGWMGKTDERRRVLRQFAGRLSAHFAHGDWETPLDALWGSRRTLSSIEARFLFDLQKACVDHERVVMSLDTWGWLRSLGQKSIKQPMPLVSPIRVVSHLRHALALSSKLHRLPDHAHQPLKALLKASFEQQRAALRAALGPLLEASLVEVGLKSGSRVEQRARQKLMDELCDRAEHEGFLRMSDLRDAIARNLCKLPTIEALSGWWRDPLLRLDARLQQTARGVYRPGEVYLRLLQRVSALGFGTKTGRWLILWLVLPLLGAFMVLEGLEHTLGVLLAKVGVEVHFGGLVRIGVLALVLWGLIHSARFRKGTWRLTQYAGRGLKALFVTWPRWVLRWPPVRAFLKTALWRGLRDWVLWPLGVGWVCSLGLGRLVDDWRVVWGVSLGVGLSVSAVRSTAWWRWAQNTLRDWLVRRWRYTIHRLLPGVLQWLLDVFRRLMWGVERVLYRVDEWLRFRDGDKPWLVPLKAVAGGVWSVLAYVVRLYINLLVEPQINPIKHFPVVTVSHKMILPFTVELVKVFAAVLIPLLGTVIGGTFAAVTVVLLPGVFGFLAWEFKENWRLYAQNQAPHLRPVLIGDHGEDMGRLLRLGFHSGTIPKLHANLRKAERKRALRGVAHSLRKHQESLLHVAHAVALFVERDMLALLRAHPKWPLGGLLVGHVTLSAHRVVVPIHALDGGPPLVLSIREQHQWLVARIDQQGWLAESASLLDVWARSLLSGALAGLYHQAGVQLVEEHYLPALAGEKPLLDHHINRRAVVVWTGNDYLGERSIGLLEEGGAPPLAALRFDLQPLRWPDWVAFWEAESTPPAAFQTLPAVQEPALDRPKLP